MRGVPLNTLAEFLQIVARITVLSTAEHIVVAMRRRCISCRATERDAHASTRARESKADPALLAGG